MISRARNYELANAQTTNERLEISRACIYICVCVRVAAVINDRAERLSRRTLMIFPIVEYSISEIISTFQRGGREG